MITVKSPEEIRSLRQGGKILAYVLKRLSLAARPGVSALDLDVLAEKLLTKAGAKPAFKGYRPNASSRPFPASICISTNSVVVHGVPERNTIFRPGDVVSIDVGAFYKGLFTDGALTVGIGKIMPEAKDLIRVTKAALGEALKVIKPGKTLGDIGYQIHHYVTKHGFSMVQQLGGHGVGYSVHEDPFVPNVGTRDTGPRLKEGMVIAIEPMVTTGSGVILQRQDGSFVTKDGALAAHFEHTVAVTKKGALILTR